MGLAKITNFIGKTLRGLRVRLIGFLFGLKTFIFVGKQWSLNKIRITPVAALQIKIEDEIKEPQPPQPISQID